MRTRNRGQRRSIVSSLGLGPKQSRNKSVTSLRLTQSKGSHATTHCLQNQLKTRLSSQASRTRVANNVGRPRIRKRGSRGQHGTSRSVYSARVDPKHSNLACDSLSQSAYSTRTRNADEDSLMTSNDSALKTRGCNTKGDKSKYDVSSSDKPLRRGARRGRPSFVRGLSRALFCDGVHSINKPSDFLDTEDRVSVFKLDSSETLTVECVDLKDTSNPIKTEEAGNQFPMDYYIKKEGDNVTNYTSPVPAKRRRGRPLKSYSAAVPKLSAPMKSESKEVFFGEMLGSTSRDSCHVYSDPTKKSDVPGFNLVRVSCTSSPVSLHFGATDDVLQEVLNEVNVLGL
ncbi:unnamed protein product [Heterobilharzia americana]|nr:unnamed protein product [Heterobilharzia americana]